MVQFIENKRILINLKQCHSFLLLPEHKKANTETVFYICNIDIPANFVITCTDTDIAIILLRHTNNLKNDESNVWLNAGTRKNM